MFPAVDTRGAAAVADRVGSSHRQLLPARDGAWPERLFAESKGKLQRQFGRAQPIAAGYHKSEHTLPVPARPDASRRRPGSLKLRFNRTGTGAESVPAPRLCRGALMVSDRRAPGVGRQDPDTVTRAMRGTEPIALVNGLPLVEEAEAMPRGCTATANLPRAAAGSVRATP